MTKKVKDILKNYGGDNPGVLSQLAKIFNHGSLAGTGKLVIFPVDQGFEHGPDASFFKNPPSYDPAYHFELAISAGCNAYSAPFGFIDSVAREFAGQIPLILKANNSDSLYKNPKSPLPAITSGVEEALRLGCSAIGFTIYPGSEDSLSMYESAVKLGREARKAGLPLVIWSYPRGGSLSKEAETALDVVAYSAHIACQLGAHIVKVKPPADFFEKQKLKTSSDSLDKRVAHVIQAGFSGRRIIIFSGGPAKDKTDLLGEIKLLAKGGAFGSIVGRNVFQRPKEEALVLLKEIMEIYKKSV
ncbi:MAG: class I fructose-bisphosphate aldolase [Bdellovibrionaceae bacterium]|nr:class I fructose-bisphosphate aldolase [Pseudobdellovibrionaceae bacterium]